MRGIEGRCREGGGLHYLFLLSSLLSDVSVLSHAHTHAQYTVYTNSLFLSSPSTPLTTQNKYKYTALIVAATNGYVEAVKALVAADPDEAHLNMRVSVP